MLGELLLNIRHQLDNHMERVILLTGQASFAPQRDNFILQAR